MAFQENLNSSIDLYFFSFFRSPGSDVSHGPGCLVGFLQGYAWCSLSLCSFRGAWRYHPPCVLFSSVLI